jgi:hypothetical protein
MNTRTVRKKTAAEEEEEWERLKQRMNAATAGVTKTSRATALIERFDEALQRLRDATPRSAAHVRGFIPMPEGGGLEFDPNCKEPMMLAPWVTDTLIRGDVSVMVGDPNVGKSQMISATAMAIALNAVGPMLGEAGDGWLGAALFASNEERPAYVRARWKVLLDKLPPEKRKKRDKLLLWDKRLVIGRFDDGVITPTEECCEFVERLADWAEQGIHFAYIGLDPLSSLFAGIKENDAPQTGDAIRFLKRIAEAAYAAVEVSHHTSKATRGEETATASRGSTGTEAASDHMGTLITLPEKEHKALGFPLDKLDRILRRKGVRSRGKRAGERYFEREIISVVAEDERYPDKLCIGTVAIVTPIALPAELGLTLDNAHRWLWQAHQGHGKKRLTARRRAARRRRRIPDGKKRLGPQGRGGRARRAGENGPDQNRGRLDRQKTSAAGGHP